MRSPHSRHRCHFPGKHGQQSSGRCGSVHDTTDRPTLAPMLPSACTYTTLGANRLKQTDIVRNDLYTRGKKKTIRAAAESPVQAKSPSSRCRHSLGGRPTVQQELHELRTDYAPPARVCLETRSCSALCNARLAKTSGWKRSPSRSASCRMAAEARIFSLSFWWESTPISR